MADDSDSPLSSLLSSDDEAVAPRFSSDDEAAAAKMSKSQGIGRYFKSAPTKPKATTPEPPRRAPSPPHEYTLADNDAIAFVVMFRSRFNDAFPKSLPHYGPQDIEKGVSSELPDEHVERLLCALLGLVLNRKKDVEKDHYGRALEDAISGNKNQWPLAWNGQNPLPGEKTFRTMAPEERLTLLKALVLWSLNSSEAVQAIIKQSYKQTRRDDDKNQPKSVQPWFTDPYRCRYYLIEGIDDTYFRVYRENDGKTKKTNTWFSVAGSIEEVVALSGKIGPEGTTQTNIIQDKIKNALPRFEAGEEKRKRRDYRLARKAAFARPEPGFSLYEGRTRGKRMRYTYSDGEEEDSDIHSGRRSTRNSDYALPYDHGPTVTSSGRQVKSRVGGMYGESMLVDQRKELERDTRTSASAEPGDDSSVANGTRPQVPVARAARGRYAEGLESESETDGAESSGKEWSGNEEESDEELEHDTGDDEDEDDDMDGVVANGEDDENTQESLVVKLSYRPGTNQHPTMNGAPTSGPEHPSHKPLTEKGQEALVASAGHVSIPSIQVNGLASATNGVSGPSSSGTTTQSIQPTRPTQSNPGQQPNTVPEVAQPMDLS